MKNKILLFLICLLSILSLAFYIQNKKLEIAKKENARLVSNQKVLNSTIEYYKTKSGKNAAVTTKIVYTIKEIKVFNPELVKTIEDLKLKLKNIESINQVGTQTNIHIKAPLDSVKCFNYTTNYLNFSGCIKNDSVIAKSQSFDTLTIVTNLEKKRVLLFFRKTIGVNLNIVTANPDSNISYAKFIEVKK